MGFRAHDRRSLRWSSTDSQLTKACAPGGTPPRNGASTTPARRGRRPPDGRSPACARGRPAPSRARAPRNTSPARGIRRGGSVTGRGSLRGCVRAATRIEVGDNDVRERAQVQLPVGRGAPTPRPAAPSTARRSQLLAERRRRVNVLTVGARYFRQQLPVDDSREHRLRRVCGSRPRRRARGWETPGRWCPASPDIPGAAQPARAVAPHPRARASPRVRGSHSAWARPPRVDGSIPACAGEPRAAPRATSAGDRGSIPACAGEPDRGEDSRGNHRVDPRVCGGAPAGAVPGAASLGGSIPACAGEPAGQ